MRIGARPAAAPRRLRRPAAAVIPEPAVPGGRRVRRRPAAGEGSAPAFEKGRTKGKEKGKDKTKDKGKGKSKEGDPKKPVA